MAVNSIKSIEDAKKLDRGKILELIEPGMGWNDVPDAMPCHHYSGRDVFSSPWNETLSYKVVCCTLHYKIPLNRLFMDDEDGTVAFKLQSGNSLDGAKDILYDQKIPLSYCFSTFPVENIDNDEIARDMYGSVTFKRFINPTDIFIIEWYTDRGDEIDDEYGHSDGTSRLTIKDPKTGKEYNRDYNDPMFKYQIQRF